MFTPLEMLQTFHIRTHTSHTLTHKKTYTAHQRTKLSKNIHTHKHREIKIFKFKNYSNEREENVRIISIQMLEG